MVAGRRDRFGDAVKARRATVNQGHTGVAAQLVGHTRKLVSLRRGELPRQGFLTARQHMNGVRAACRKMRQAGRAVRDGPEHQRRIQRDRAEAVDGQTDQRPAIGFLRSDDRHAGGEGTQRVA